MAHTEAAASRQHSNPSLSGIKCGACDRCRGQKLKCLPGDQLQGLSVTTCVRCHKAGATCSFSIAKRPGRPSTLNTPLPQPRRDKAGGRPTDGKALSAPILNRSRQHILHGEQDGQADEDQSLQFHGGQRNGHFPGEHTHNQQRGGEREDIAHVLPLSPSSHRDTTNTSHGISHEFPSSSGPSTANLPWSHENLPSYYDTDMGDIPGLDPFSPKYGWPFQNHPGQPTGFQTPTPSSSKTAEQSREGNVNAYASPLQPYSANSFIPGPPEEVMDLDLPSRTHLIAQPRPPRASRARNFRARDGEGKEAQLSASLETSLIATSVPTQGFAEEQAGTDDEEGTISAQDVQHRRMQELSELAMGLYAQPLASDPENQQRTSGAKATAFQNQLVGSVLKSSDTFLELLSSFLASTTPCSSTYSPPPPTPSMHSEKPPCSPSNSNGSSTLASFFDHDDLIMSRPARQSEGAGEVPCSRSSDSKPAAPADLTTVLQLLTCYMRIIHLHSIMHAHFLDYILTFPPHQTSHSTDPLPPVFPGMQIGGVSLDRFGTVQVKLLLQISLRVLGDIELRLGLPDEYRVGKKKSGRKGVLEASVSADFIKCLMIEEAGRGMRTECVRERLVELWRVLSE